MVTQPTTKKIFDRTLTQFIICTSSEFQDHGGHSIVDMAWFNVMCWDAPVLAKGDKVRVTGRLRSQRYTTSDGNEVNAVSIMATKVSKYED